VHYSRTLTFRLAALAAAVALFAGALAVAGAATWQLWALLIAPDVALLLGMAPGLERGQLHPRAVRLYNALHAPAGPLALAAVALLLGSDAWLAGALAWGTHIAIDRAAGYGPRDREGFIRWTARA
jgi:hypothetical protein